ncbi:hypothetical protein [Staphylococcus xylosus]|uniref:hypothetical protein n=1 Tax=Staphylococcus xylosus TaxID=1288 RepID=UPI003F54C40D
MAYEYEGYIKNTIRTESVFSHETEQKYNRILELQEVYSKAKAFDEFKNYYHTEIAQAINNLKKFNTNNITGATIFLLEKILSDLEGE